MVCPNCHTSYLIIPLKNGEKKWCDSCGMILYTFENDSIQLSNTSTNSFNNEAELRERIAKEKEARFKEQLERKEKENEFRIKLENERILQEQQEHKRKQQQREEQDKLFQLQIDEEIRLKERLHQVQLEKEILEFKRLQQNKTEQDTQRLENEIKQFQQQLLQLELEKNKREVDLLEKINKERAEKEKLILAEQERIAKQTIQIQLQEHERQQHDKLLYAQLEQERRDKERLENELQLTQQSLLQHEHQEHARLQKELLAKQEQVAQQIHYSSSKNTIHPKKKYLKLVLPILCVLLVLGAIFKYKNNVSFFQNSTTKNRVLANPSNQLNAVNLTKLNADSTLILAFKNNIQKVGILSWNEIYENEIKNVVITNVKQDSNALYYDVHLLLEDQVGTKANAILSINCKNLSSIRTQKITYSNIAPANAWFSFSTIPNCSITMNTNNNPIQLKTCLDCEIQKIVSDVNTEISLQNTSSISIKSDNKFDAIVDFTYTPILSL